MYIHIYIYIHIHIYVPCLWKSQQRTACSEHPQLYVCTYEFMYVYTYEFMCVCTYELCMYVRTNLCMYVRTNLCMLYAFTYEFMHVCMLWLYILVYIYVCSCGHLHICTLRIYFACLITTLDASCEGLVPSFSSTPQDLHATLLMLALTLQLCTRLLYLQFRHTQDTFILSRTM